MNTPKEYRAFMPVRLLGPPAAALTMDERCSDCGVKPVLAGDRDLKVCPKCYSVLWHAVWEQPKKPAPPPFKEVHLEEPLYYDD